MTIRSEGGRRQSSLIGCWSKETTDWKVRGITFSHSHHNSRKENLFLPRKQVIFQQE